jgi:hypothetical protein
LRFWKIFLEYFWNILLKTFEEIFKIKKIIHTIWQKMSFKKKMKSIYKFFYCLKANVIMFNEGFC